jgi:hypothetical protein
VLEPSAGLGRLIDAILHPIQMPIAPAEVVAVEMEPVLCRHLYENYDSCNGEKTLYQRDFLTMKPAETGLFDAIIMNPPFHMRSDIKHILHALTFLKPEGKLAAICMEGPHRDKALRPLASKWISLDPAAFQGDRHPRPNRNAPHRKVTLLPDQDNPARNAFISSNGSRSIVPSSTKRNASSSA